MTKPASELIALADREAFIEVQGKYLDLTECSDAWGRPMFMHPLIQAMWDGWRKGRDALRTAAKSGSERAGVDALREALDCLQSIADMEDNEPRQPDDADWRFRALECKRAAQCTIAALAREEIGAAEEIQSSDGGVEGHAAVPLEIPTQRSGESRDPLGDGSVKVGPHREDAAGIKPGPSEAPSTHGKPDGAVREALDDVGVFFRLLRGPSYVADAFSLNVTNAEYKKAREGFDKLKAALRDATEKVNWTPFEDGAAPWSEDEQFEERAKACKSRCKQYGYTCGQGGEEDYEYEGECDDCDRDAQEVLRKKYLKPTALQSKIAAAPMFETKEEADEAADNGRNTGGKSYYRPTENKIAAAETSPGDVYREVIDEALIVRHLGVAKGNAKAELNQILDWDVAAALDPAVSGRKA